MRRRRRRRSKISFQQVGRTRKENMLLTFSTVIYFIVAFVWWEFAFHFAMFDGFSLKFFFPILFSIPTGVFFGLLCNLTPSKLANYIITCVLTFLCCFLCGVEIVYYSIFTTFTPAFSMIAQGTAAQAFAFGPFLAQGIANIWTNIFSIILILVPFIFILTIGRTLLSYRQRQLPIQGILAGALLVLHLLCLLIVGIGNKDDGSIYDLYHHNSSLDQAVEDLGLATSMRLDLRTVIFGEPKTNLDDLDIESGNNDWMNVDKQTEGSDETKGPDETVDETAETTEPEKEPDIHDLYNFTDIDFEKLIADAEAAGNKDLATMHKFYYSQEPTNKNEYSGIYEGYNLIFITAEGFSPHAVHKDLTPTLYKLVNTGYVFTNFYTPLWFGSTLAGEYANIVSQFPSNGGRISMEVTGENRTDMYYSLGRTMERAGYNLWAFHNNTPTYYNRDQSHPNMGYERWIAQGTGYDPEMNSSGSKPLWPQSDLHMIDTTFDMYVDQEPFHAYYLTVSAHAEYNFGGNAMAKRNQEAVANLPMSDEAKAYIACNIELDKAMESLIKKLEDAGIADRTLVVLTADHIPYGDAYKEALNEIEAYKRGVSSYQIEQEYERYRNNLIIWTGSMEETVVVDKLCSSVDVLPTVYNMLGLEYESRVLAGRDIFSDSEGIVIFPNASYITDIARYSNKTLETTSLTGEELPEGYASSMVKSVRNRLKISRMFVEMDYYKYLH